MAGMMPGGGTPQKARQSLPQGRECPTLEPSTDCQIPAILCCRAAPPFVHGYPWHRQLQQEHVPTHFCVAALDRLL